MKYWTENNIFSCHGFKSFNSQWAQDHFLRYSIQIFFEIKQFPFQWCNGNKTQRTSFCYESSFQFPLGCFQNQNFQKSNLREKKIRQKEKFPVLLKKENLIWKPQNKSLFSLWFPFCFLWWFAVLRKSIDFLFYHLYNIINISRVFCLKFKTNKSRKWQYMPDRFYSNWISFNIFHLTNCSTI